MAHDERITDSEWDKNIACPICVDIAKQVIDLEGKQLFEDESEKKPFFCPACGAPDIREFHEVGGVESQASSLRGDTQPWTHLIKVKCMTCEWSHVVGNLPCLGNPWNETHGYSRPKDMTDLQKKAVMWSNEQAVGLRGAHEKFNPDDELRPITYRSRRKVEWDESDGEDRTITWEPTDEEKELPKFRKKKGRVKDGKGKQTSNSETED
mgnify:CR=1 FL=1|tara:strand:- start:2093 stop:2719 length:627 start_codon:yes stop_codon:yes gene_type:complete